ncbi:MAG: substrate-binding domain-containing protein [Pseudomonadota bacterium]
MSTPPLSRALLPAILATIPAFSHADDIELRSPDGFISIEGEILSINENGMITVATSVGDVTVPAVEVACFGAACPDEGVARGVVEESVTVAAADSENVTFMRNFLLTTTASSSRRAQTTDGSVALQGSGDDQLTRVSFQTDPSAEDPAVTITNITPISAQVPDLGPVTSWASGTQLPSQLLAAKALSVVASPEAGVTNLTIDDLARIYAGELTNWSELGGADFAITPIQVASSERLHQDVQDLVLTPSGKELSSNVFMVADIGAIFNVMISIPGAISVVPTEVSGLGNVIGVTDSCGVASRATPFSVSAGIYPLTLSTVAVYEQDVQTTLTQVALDKAALSAYGDPVVEAGFAAPGLYALDKASTTARLTTLMEAEFDGPNRLAALNLMQRLFDAKQLSATFTDGPQSQTEGAWSRAHFVRLADAIRAGDYDGHDVMFVGFAEETADPAEAIALSERAATNILAAFDAFAPDVTSRPDITFTASGHGAVSKVRCFHNGVDAARGTSIEVWVRPKT